MEWGVARVANGKGKTLAREWTSEESDFLMTTRAVPATYEPKDRHNKEFRRLQVVDSWGRRGDRVKLAR